MLRAIVISPDEDLAAELAAAAPETGLAIVRRLDRYPGPGELPLILTVHAPQVLFLSLAARERAFELAREAGQSVPGIQIAAIHRSCEPDVLLELMRAGIRELVTAPVSRPELESMVGRLGEAVTRKPPAFPSSDLAFTVLPAKAGVGASTVALNAAVALAAQPDTRVLLADLDLNSGMLRFMLKLQNECSVLDACRHAANLDERLWPRLVTSLGNLDVLHAGRMNLEMRVDTFQLRHLLDFARRLYRVIVMDLSGNMEKYSINLIHESKRVFLVTTPELPALHLAREKLVFLQGEGLSERVWLALNRVSRRDAMTAEQVERLLETPVAFQFPNDYAGVHRALAAGGAVDANTDFGKRFQELAREMLHIRQPKPKKRFIEYFSVASARDGRQEAGRKDRAG